MHASETCSSWKMVLSNWQSIWQHSLVYMPWNRGCCTSLSGMGSQLKRRVCASRAYIDSMGQAEEQRTQTRDERPFACTSVLRCSCSILKMLGKRISSEWSSLVLTHNWCLQVLTWCIMESCAAESAVEFLKRVSLSRCVVWSVLHALVYNAWMRLSLWNIDSTH